MLNISTFPGAGSLFESMISMTSSIQLATEIQQTEPPDPAEQDSMQNVAGQTIEGIELIAKSLDSSKSWIYLDIYMLVCWDEILELFFGTPLVVQ